MTFAIGEYLLGVVDLFLLTPLLVFAWTQVTRPSNRATAADVEAHSRDFPFTSLVSPPGE
jgi:hypothetical protein